MANAFDQFDAAPVPSPPIGGPASTAGNPFDQFDAPAPAPARAASFDDRFAASGPSDAAALAPLGEGMRRVADERLVGPPSAKNAIDAGLFRAADAFGLNIPRNMMAGAEALRSGKGFDESYRYVTDVEDALARQYPKTALAGTVGGVVGGAVSLPAVAAKAGAGIVRRAGANALTGALYGGAAEAFDKKTVEDTFSGAGWGGAFGAGGGLALEAGGKVYAALSRAKIPFRDQTGQLTAEASAAMREAGIDPAQITPDLAAQLEQAFTVKGPSAGAAREALAADQGITLSRAQATRDPAAADLESGARSGARGGRAQQIGDEFAARQAGEIDAARGRLQGMAARGAPVIDNPQVAFEAAADRARFAGARYADEAGRVRGEQDAALRAVQGPAPTDPLEGATLAVQGAREAAERSRGAYGAAYDDVGAIEGTFLPDAFSDAGARVRAMIGLDTPINSAATPVAAQALAMIDDLPRALGLAPGQGPTAQQIMALRKGLTRLYGSTGQNGTDRHALGEVTRAFDRNVEDLFAIGQFRRGPAGGEPPAGAPRAAGEAGDGFPIDVPPADAIPVPEAPRGSPESLLTFLFRGGGVPLDAEARAADLHRLYRPGNGTLARRNAPTWDDLRVRLNEAGFLPPDDAGYARAEGVRDFVLDAIHQERIGRGATLRLGEEAGTGARAAERIADENAGHLDMVDRQARRMLIDLEGYGLRPQDIDREALHDAAELMMRREVDDAADAYDLAVARRGERGGEAPRPTVGEDAPFPEMGEGVGPASSDALPIGDTGPADAMRRARGLFREHRQAFAPRGPGDVAGQRLQRIVERDASPNEAVGMLFGTTTGRVASGQLQTLARLREAVGPESETWRSVQQAIVSRYVSGDGRDLGQRLDYLLRGEGRALAAQFLTEEQRGGLGRLRAAVTQTEAAGAAAPAWVQSLERAGFDPNAIASSLFGSGVPGSRAGALNEARAAKAFLGADSAEWSMLRQAAVQKITDPSAKAGAVVDRLGAFTDGAGSGLARELFSPEELGQLRRFRAALRSTLLPDGSARPNVGAAAGVAAKALDVLAGMLAFKVGGPGAGLGVYGAKVGQRALIGGAGARRARQSFEGGAPRMRRPAPVLPTGEVAVGAGLAVGDYR